jgi:hypothetical protein
MHVANFICGPAISLSVLVVQFSAAMLQGDGKYESE